MKRAILLVALLGASLATAGEIEIFDFSYKLMGTGQTIEDWSWQMKLQNLGEETLRCRFTIELLDADGFIVQTDTESATVRAGEEVTIRGQTITSKPSGIVNAELKGSC